MASIAPDASLDEQAHRAWVDYREALRDLHGAEYETAESESWDRLQERLRDVERRRSHVTSING